MKPLPVILTVLAVYAALRVHRHLVACAMRDGVELGAAHAGNLTMTENGVHVHNPSVDCPCFACRQFAHQSSLVVSGGVL